MTKKSQILRTYGIEGHSELSSRASITWLAVGHLANDWPVAALWLIVPAAGLAMNLSPGEVGLLFTLFGLGGALAYIPAGLLADHVSDRGRLLTATFCWVAVGYALAALASDFWSLAMLLAVAGMGNAAWHPIAAGVLTRENKESRARALGIHALGGSLAEILAPLSVGVLLSHLDWRGALVVSVVPTVLLGLCFVWVAKSIPRVDRRPVDRQEILEQVHAWRSAKGLQIMTMISLNNMALTALLGMIPLYLASAHDLAPTTIGAVFAALLMSGALAQPWVGGQSDRIGRRRILLIGNGLATLAITALVFDPAFWIMIALMAVGVACLDAIRAAMLATAVEYTGRGEGATLGVAFVMIDGVGALGALLAGMAAGISWTIMFGVVAVFACAAAILSMYATPGRSATST